MPQPTSRFDDPDTYAIIGAAMAVHAELGCGFLEAVYKAALAIELRQRGVPFDREVTLPIAYKGEPLPLNYRVDFMCVGGVLVETKARDALTTIDQAQIINYLRASNCQRGLLLNFGARSLEHRRVVWGFQRDPPSNRNAWPPRPGSSSTIRHRR